MSMSMDTTRRPKWVDLNVCKRKENAHAYSSIFSIFNSNASLWETMQATLLVLFTHMQHIMRF